MTVPPGWLKFTTDDGYHQGYVLVGHKIDVVRRYGEDILHVGERFYTIANSPNTRTLEEAVMNVHFALLAEHQAFGSPRHQHD